MILLLLISYLISTSFSADSVCPEPTGPGVCAELCGYTGQQSCSNGTLCCSNGCGHVCTEPVSICSLNKDVGPCEAVITRYYYDSEELKCKEFVYGGCEGNSNNFETLLNCNAECPASCREKRGCYSDFECVHVDGCNPDDGNRYCDGFCEPVDICSLKKDAGSCKELVTRYYYDSKEKKCKRFVYGGCEGNSNNFETLSDCNAECPAFCGGREERGCDSGFKCVDREDDDCNPDDGDRYCDGFCETIEQISLRADQVGIVGDIGTMFEDDAYGDTMVYLLDEYGIFAAVVLLAVNCVLIWCIVHSKTNKNRYHVAQSTDISDTENEESA